MRRNCTLRCIVVLRNAFSAADRGPFALFNIAKVMSLNRPYLSTQLNSSRKSASQMLSYGVAGNFNIWLTTVSSIVLCRGRR